jgi:hypothetical protein
MKWIGAIAVVGLMLAGCGSPQGSDTSQQPKDVTLSEVLAFPASFQDERLTFDASYFQMNPRRGYSGCTDEQVRVIVTEPDQPTEAFHNMCVPQGLAGPILDAQTGDKFSFTGTLRELRARHRPAGMSGALTFKFVVDTIGPVGTGPDGEREVPSAKFGLPTSNVASVAHQ